MNAHRSPSPLFPLLVVLLMAGLTVASYWPKPAPRTVAPTPAPTNVEQCLKAAEVIDLDGDGIGTCWPVAVKDGCVAFVSCQHVAECDVNRIKMPNGDIAPVVSSICNEDVDVAVIWARANPHLPVTVIPMAEKFPERGAKGMLSGYPLDCGLWMSEGFIASKDAAGVQWTSIPIYYGCSGGPVVVNGEAVGLARGIEVDPYRRQIVSTLSQIVRVDSFRDWVREIVLLGPK